MTVLVPVRDGMPWLRHTWATLRRARGPALELLFVDDGSADETPAFLAACAATDRRVRVLRQSPHGLVAALNRGLAEARAPWIARLDADDLVHPERFVRQLDRAESHGLDVVGTGVRCFPAPAVAGGLRRYEAWQNELLSPEALARDRFVESPLVHPSVMFRRDLVREAGGYRDLGHPEDYDLWLRLFARGLRFGKCPETLTFWRERPDRLTRTAAHCAAEAVADCKALHLLDGPLRQTARVYIAGTGDDGKRLARRLAARGRPADAFLDLNPRRLGQRIGGAPVRRWEEVAHEPGVVLAAIGAAGGRERVRAYFRERGLLECRDFWCVA